MSTELALNNKGLLLKNHLNEYVKTHIEFDVGGRIEYVYTAHTDTKDQGDCICTRYAYVGTTSVVVYMREYPALWLAAWELF